MCGIVGVISKTDTALTNVDLEVFKEMLICDSIRGDDSTGVFSINKAGNANWLKLATNPYSLLNSKAYKDFRSEAWRDGVALIGHNRKATQGEVNNENAHPFIFGNTILIHNGGLENWRQLLSWKERDKHKIEVDSHGACVLLARNAPGYIIPKMKGAFTFVWYDVQSKMLNFIRNEERPLHFANMEQSVFFASEPGMLGWLLTRRGLDTKNRITSLKPGVMLSMNFNDRKAGWTHQPIDLSKQEVLPPVPLHRQPVRAANEEPDEDDVALRMTEAGRAVRRLFGEHAKVNQSDWKVNVLPKDRFNIHYGKNQFVVKDEVPFQQLVFTVDDYKLDPEDKSGQTWDMVGHALDSDRLDVVFKYHGDEKQAEKIAYSTYLIGRVATVMSKKYSADQKLRQEIIVSNVEPVELTTSKNGSPLTEDHFEYLLKHGMCECNQYCSNFIAEDLEVDTNGPTVKVVCTWCREGHNAVAEAGK